MNARGRENLAYFNQYANVRAFAYMTMRAEGTLKHGYYTYFGGSRLPSLAAHPNRAVKIGRYTSSASGAFQFLSPTWAGLKAKLGLTDFSEDSQNAAFVELLREKNALQVLLSGDFDRTVYLVRKVWASFPGAGYGQGEKTMVQVREWYLSALNGSNGSNISNKADDSSVSPAAVILGIAVLYLVFK